MNCRVVLPYTPDKVCLLAYVLFAGLKKLGQMGKHVAV